MPQLKTDSQMADLNPTVSLSSGRAATPKIVDACVIGGGPAGTTAALRLAKLGHRVLLIEASCFPRCHIGECLSSGIWNVLNVLGLRNEICSIDHVKIRETKVQWAHERAEIVQPAQQMSAISVDRSTFDSHLLNAARSAGVIVVQPARARVCKDGPIGWTVIVDAQGERFSLRARFLVDASGRSRSLPGLHKVTSMPTLAVCGYLHNHNLTSQIIAAFSDGWIWAAPVPRNRISAMVFVDPSLLRSCIPMSLERFYVSQLERSELVAKLSRLPVCDKVVARTATSSFALDPIGEDFVRVGDACISLNPLSATGVEWAMQSGCTAATVVHTIISHPERSKICLDFYRDRQHLAVSNNTTWSAAHFGAVVRYREYPFWSARSHLQTGEAVSKVAQTIAPPVHPQGLRIDTRVRIAPTLRFVRSPCIIDDEVQLHLTLEHPNLARPVAFIEGVDLSELLNWPPSADATDRTEILRDLMVRWAQRMAKEQAMRILAWLLEKQILEPVT